MTSAVPGAAETGPLRAFGLVTVGLVMAALVIDGLDYQLLALVAPLILDEWGLSFGEFGMAMAAALFGMAFGAAAGGWLGDRIGRLRALVGAVILFGAATVAASLADSVAGLAALRMIGGVGFGAAGPNAIALASEWMPLRLRTYVVALLAIGTPLGGMIGSVLLPEILPGLGWRGVFVVLGLLAIVLGTFLILVLREPPRPAAAPREADAARLFARDHMRLNLGIGLSFAALTAIVYGLGSWMPSFLAAAGFTLEQALRASFAFSASSILGALAAGWLARTQGSRRVMLASAIATGLLLAGFGLTLDAVAGIPAQPARFGIYALAGGVGAAASIGVTTLYAMAVLLYPAEIRSSGIGLGMTMGRVGGIAMSFAGGYLLDFSGGSAALLFGVLAACALLATSAGWLVRLHIPRGG